MVTACGTRSQENPILVVGGGVAGIAAALDLANAGRPVHLVEQAHHLGGQVAKLDKLFPTDHCAFCPLWTEIKKCREHPRITLHTAARVRELRHNGEGYVATVVEGPHLINADRCIYCGRCLVACPEKRDVPGQPASTSPIRVVWEHAYPPSYVIDAGACTRCGLCQIACPTGAIDLERSELETVMAVDDVIWATGFKEADLGSLKEFGSGTHPDIMSAMEFEAWVAEAGPNQGNILKKSNGRVPRSVAFVQCAGSRDKRLLPYCSAVCCMHALKQAHWVKRRHPEVSCVIFFTDLRTVGKNYYEYALRAVGQAELELIRGRPGLIIPLPEGETIAVKYEDTLTQKREIRRFDMVVLNGALESCLEQPGNEKAVSCLREGHRATDRACDVENQLTCGFAREPADVAESVIQASAAALQVALKAKTKR